MIFPFQCHMCISSSANSCHLINTSRYIHQCSFCFISQGKDEITLRIQRSIMNSLFKTFQCYLKSMLYKAEIIKNKIIIITLKKPYCTVYISVHRLYSQLPCDGWGLGLNWTLLKLICVFFHFSGLWMKVEFSTGTCSLAGRESSGDRGLCAHR